MILICQVVVFLVFRLRVLSISTMLADIFPLRSTLGLHVGQRTSFPQKINAETQGFVTCCCHDVDMLKIKADASSKLVVNEVPVPLRITT